MLKKIIPLSLLLLVIGAGVGYLFFAPADTKQAAPPPTQNTSVSETPTKAPPKPSTPVDAIKASAALQFNVPENEITIVNSEKKQWTDTCFDIVIPDFTCEKKIIDGYEVTIETSGFTTTYRTNDDWSVIRTVKDVLPSPSAEPTSESEL
jgi:hypothetical protein